MAGVDAGGVPWRVLLRLVGTSETARSWVRMPYSPGIRAVGLRVRSSSPYVTGVGTSPPTGLCASLTRWRRPRATCVQPTDRPILLHTRHGDGCPCTTTRTPRSVRMATARVPTTSSIEHDDRHQLRCRLALHRRKCTSRCVHAVDEGAARVRDTDVDGISARRQRAGETPRRCVRLRHPCG